MSSQLNKNKKLIFNDKNKNEFQAFQAQNKLIKSEDFLSNKKKEQIKIKTNMLEQKSKEKDEKNVGLNCEINDIQNELVKMENEKKELIDINKSIEEKLEKTEKELKKEIEIKNVNKILISFLHQIKIL